MLFTRTIKDKLAEIYESIDEALFQLAVIVQGDRPETSHTDLDTINERLEYFKDQRSEAITRFQVADEAVTDWTLQREALITTTGHPSVSEDYLDELEGHTSVLGDPVF